MSKFVTVNDRDFKIEGRLLRTARIDGEKYLFIEDAETVIQALRKCGKRIDLFTFMQRVCDRVPRYQYPMVWDNFAVLPVSTYNSWWTKQIGFKARNKAKQAEKHGVTLSEVPYSESLVHGVWEIYNETPVRQGKKFPNFGMTLDEMHSYLGTFLDRSVFIGAFFEQRLVGFIKLTIDETATQAGLMHILSMVGERDKAPTNALLARAVRSCADRQIPYLVYSNFSYGNKQSDSLSDFKERNGFEKIDVPRYYVPLTSLGSTAFHFGAHRRLTDVLPEGVIAKVREFRSAWYSRKSQVSAKAS